MTALRWFDRHPIAGFFVGSVAMVALWLAFVVAMLQPPPPAAAQTAYTPPKLTAAEKEFVVMCSRRSSAAQGPYDAINECVTRARVLSEWGWL